MKTIKKELINEIIIKNSKFINILIPINSNKIDYYLNYYKEKYPKATHYCYAYIYQDIKKCSDDNEPSQTAGMPMLNVLESNNLINVLTITIRYFGGIKLGAGGLVRAYTKSVTENLKNQEFIELEEGYLIKIKFPYSKEKEIKHFIKEKNIKEKTYQENITFVATISKEKLKDFLYPYKIIEEVLIEKDS